jgi:hypothetical protein
VKVGDLVKYKGEDFQTWLGYIVKEIPGTSQIKVVEWWNTNGSKERSSHPAEYLELVNEDR